MINMWQKYVSPYFYFSLQQRFSAGGNFAPYLGNLALSRDIFCCQDWRVEVQITSGMLVNFLQEAGSPHNKELSGEDVTSAEVEKLYYRT